MLIGNASRAFPWSTHLRLVTLIKSHKSLSMVLYFELSFGIPPNFSQTWYSTILPLYFPRNQKEEEFAAKALPLDLGDEFGEPIILERKIRISDNPVKGMQSLE